MTGWLKHYSDPLWLHECFPSLWLWWPRTCLQRQLKWFLTLCALFGITFAGLWVPNGPAMADVSDSGLSLDTGDTSWMLAATGLVLFMTPGLALFYGGMVQHQNIISTILQCFICLGIIGVLWIFYGFGLAFGEDCGSFIGNPWTYLFFRNVGTAPNPDFATTIPFQLFALFQLKFAAITPALTAGGYVERLRFGPFLAFVVLFMTLIYCPIAHWVWHPQGFLRVWGVQDFAGGTVVHMSSGTSALAAALVVGKRSVVQQKEEIFPVNVPFVILGTAMLWFGWFGFNAGSALTAGESAVQAFLNTNTATSAAMLTILALDGWFGKKPSAVRACVGAVIGLVVITPAAGLITVGQSLFFGFIGACICWVMIHLVQNSGIDDGLDAFGSHGIGGMSGCILTGAFCKPHSPVFDGDFSFFGFYWAAVLIVLCWSFIWTIVILKFLSFFMHVRLEPELEKRGLDETQHGESILWGIGLPPSRDLAKRLLGLDTTVKEMTQDPSSILFDPSIQFPPPPAPSPIYTRPPSPFEPAPTYMAPPNFYNLPSMFQSAPVHPISTSPNPLGSAV